MEDTYIFLLPLIIAMHSAPLRLDVPRHTVEGSQSFLLAVLDLRKNEAGIREKQTNKKTTFSSSVSLSFPWDISSPKHNSLLVESDQFSVNS